MKERQMNSLLEFEVQRVWEKWRMRTEEKVGTYNRHVMS